MLIARNLLFCGGDLASLILQGILRDLHPLATLHCRLVRDDSGEGHVQCFSHIDDGFFIQQDGFDEMIGQLPMRAAMSTGSDARWQWWAFAADPFIVWFLSVDTTLFTMGVFHVPATRHP